MIIHPSLIWRAWVAPAIEHELGTLAWMSAVLRPYHSQQRHCLPQWRQQGMKDTHGNQNVVTPIPLAGWPIGVVSACLSCSRSDRETSPPLVWETAHKHLMLVFASSSFIYASPWRMVILWILHHSVNQSFLSQHMCGDHLRWPPEEEAYCMNICGKLGINSS